MNRNACKKRFNRREPQIAHVAVQTADGSPAAPAAPAIREIVETRLARVGEQAGELVEGRIQLGSWPLHDAG